VKVMFLFFLISDGFLIQLKKHFYKGSSSSKMSIFLSSSLTFSNFSSISTGSPRKLSKSLSSCSSSITPSRETGGPWVFLGVDIPYIAYSWSCLFMSCDSLFLWFSCSAFSCCAFFLLSSAYSSLAILAKRCSNNTKSLRHFSCCSIISFSFKTFQRDN